MVQIIVKEGTKVDFPRELTEYSKKLESLDGDSDTIQEPHIRECVLRRIIDFLHSYDKSEKELAMRIAAPSSDKSGGGGDNGTSVDSTPDVRTLKSGAEFCRDNANIIAEVYLAASRLSIRILITPARNQLSSMISDMSTKQIGELLHIKCDMTPQQVELIERQNRWMEEL